MTRPVSPPSLRRPHGLFLLACGVALTTLCGCDLLNGPHVPAGSGSFTNIGYATFAPSEPAYRMAPGDVIDVAFPSAPELNREVTVQPDGRIGLPLVSPVMAADQSVPDLQGALSQVYGPLLVRPEVDVSVRTATPLRVFVGGEVAKPGVYDMPGDINALQAVVMAGGFTNVAKRHNVVIIRRGAGGRPMMRIVDLRNATFDPVHTDAAPLRRFDVVYVPRTDIGNADLFVEQYFRDIVPISFSYALSGGLYGTTP
ncbi:polysaccharide biosynthesis/export family protein [Caulobacter sp. S45]|uniref:polysaccharide biosynthesis/export family protein n=1 Tax=Caulobacter sp. S45 TaxID=1641861 RepID=UPI001576524E|nr:polysaccharide biosynthesis/export family protein [Caulobacter sp. S45]